MKKVLLLITILILITGCSLKDLFVRENDTIEQILEQFKVTKEELESYNDLSSITVGLKLIIPANKDEKI